MSEEIPKDLDKQWAEYTQEERESMVDTLLGELRKLMIQSDTVINMSMQKPTYREGFGVRFTGEYIIKVEASGRIKPYCHLCGNSGRLQKLGVQEPRLFPFCTCEVGRKAATRRPQ